MKYIKLLSLIAAVSLVSCVDETAYENSTEQQGPETVNPEYTHFITLVASSDATKIEHDGAKVKWSAGDKIKIYFDGGSAESLGAVLSDEGATASFKIPLEAPLADDAKIYAVYPSTTAASLDGETFNVTIPAEQSAIYRNADILAACSTVEDASLTFHHVAGLVSFTVSEGNPKGIDSGVFKDFYKSAAIAGTCPLTFDEEGLMTIGEAVDTKTQITLKDIQAGENYIAVIPDVTMESVGLKLKANGKFLTPNATDNDLKVSAAHIRPVGVVDTDMSDAYYIKPGATGKGTSWDDAAGVSLISELMSTPFPKQSDIYQRYAAAWRLDGQEIRMTEGTYELSGTMNADTKIAFTFQATDFMTKTTFTVDGGYDADGVKSETAKAAFTGNNAHPVMALWKNVVAEFKNVKFMNGLNDGTDVSNGISGIGGVVDLDNGSVVTFDNCEFNANKSAQDFGGAVAITDAGTTATFNSCSFDGNECSMNGGAVYIGNSSATFNGCTFVRNKTTSVGGGAIFYNNSKVSTTLTIINSTFEANTATNGGAALLLSNGMKATVKGTTFKNNNVTSTSVNVGYYGVVAITGNTTSTSSNANFESKIHVDFEDCDFLSNKCCALNVSSIWPTDADISSSYTGQFVSLDGCCFEGNTSIFKAAAVLVQGSLPVFMNACTFKNNIMGGARTDSGVTVAMASGNSGWFGMLAMNNCTFSGGQFTNSPEGYVYLRGKSIVSNCTILGDGQKPALTYGYNAKWGNSDGSILVNSIVCNESADTYNPVVLNNDNSYTITGYYNLYQGLTKLTNNKYVDNSDSVIAKDF